MSEENELKITSVEKVKDPKRVAAGKKLAQISKEAKERKLRVKIQEEKGYNYFFIVGSMGMILAALLYYTYRREDIIVEQPKPTSTLDSLD